MSLSSYFAKPEDTIVSTLNSSNPSLTTLSIPDPYNLLSAGNHWFPNASLSSPVSLSSIDPYSIKNLDSVNNRPSPLFPGTSEGNFSTTGQFNPSLPRTEDSLTGQATFTVGDLATPTIAPNAQSANSIPYSPFQSSTSNTVNQLFFVDSSVSEFDRWMDAASETSQVIFLNGHDALSQIAQTLTHYQSISVIHLVTHGADGELRLGDTTLNSGNLANYAPDFQNWRTTLAPNADILLYGCDVAEDKTGQQFVQQLSSLTGADVAASTDATGNSFAGGNWTLEYQVGKIEHQTFSPNNYQSLLGLAEVSIATGGILQFRDKTGDLIPANANLLDLYTATASLNSTYLSYDYSVDTVNLNPVNNVTLDLRTDGLYIQDKNSQIVFQTVAANSLNSAITRVDANTVKVDFASISKVDINTDESKASLLLSGLSSSVNLADDTITFASGFDQVSKIINFSIDGGIGTDTVIFESGSNFKTQGGSLDVKAEKITVKEGITISTQKGGGDSGSVTFSGTEINVQKNAKILANSGSNLTSSGDIKILGVDERSFSDTLVSAGLGFSSNKTSITIDEGAILKGKDITLDVQAQGLQGSDVSIAEKYTGTALREIAGLLAALPFGFKGQNSEAVIDLKPKVEIESQGNIRISSKAKAENKISVTTKDGADISQQVGVVLAWSEATAKTLVGEGVKISAPGDVNLISDTTTIADTTARVSRNLGLTTTDNQTKALSIATAYTKATSNAIVAQDAQIRAGGNVNILATGINNNATTAQTGSYQDGQFGLTVSVGVADSDIRTEVNGQITAQGAGQSLYVFDPNGTVDVDKDTIDLGVNHSLKTGDRVIYRNHDPNDLSSTNRSIGNLADGKVYYAIVESPTKIKLAETIENAIAGKAIDLRVIQFGEWGTRHQIELEATKGIGIRATLNSQESNKAEVGIGGGTLDKVLDLILSGKTEVLTDGIRASRTLKSALQTEKDSIWNTINSKVFPQQAGPANANSDWSVAGSFALGSTAHKVLAQIGSKATLKSGANLDVKAIQIDTPAIGAASGIAKGDNTSKDTAISAAVSLGLYKNTVQAILDQGAQLDARQTMSINARTYYPLIYDQLGSLFNSLNVTYPNEVSKKLLETQLRDQPSFGANPIYDIKALVNAGASPTFSLPGVTTPWNSWTKASSESDKLGIAGSINLFKFTNTTEAIVSSGVKINQDTGYLTDSQQVNIKALTTGTLVNITGNPVKLVGGANDTAGVGGSIYGSLFRNITIAKVDSGALIRTGKDSGLTVDATTKLTNVNVVYSGSRGKTFAVNGTVAVNLYDSLTMAQVASGAQITGGFMTVNALDDTNYWNFVGGALLGQNIGIGASVAITDMDRNTFALIGAPDDQTTAILKNSKFNRAPATIVQGNTTLNLTGPLKVQAKNDGDNYDISLAASVIYSSSTDAEKAGDIQKQASGISSDPLEGASLPNSLSSTGNKVSNAQGQQGQFGLGISGDVSIHTITDNVFAYINEFSTSNTSVSITAAQVDVNATNDTDFFSLAGSIAFASSQQGSSAGIAGSFAKNSLDGATRAYIANNTSATPQTFNPNDAVNFDTEQINLGNHSFATGDAVVYTKAPLTYGLFGFTSADPLGGLVSGQAYYVIVDKNQPQLIQLAASLEDARAGRAINLSKSFFSNFGPINTLSPVKADLKLKLQTTGSVAVNANNRARTISGTAGGSGAPGQNGVAVAGSVALNFVNYKTDAFLDRVDMFVGANQLDVAAKDDSSIIALGGSVGFGGRAGFGASIAFNKVDNSVTATINRSNVLLQLGQAKVAATNNAQIRSYVGSLALSSEQQGIGGAGTIAVNLISGKTEAALLNSTMQGTQGLIDLAINAEDTSLIQSFAGGIGVSGATGFGAAAAYNSSDRTTKARIEGSQTQLRNINKLTIAAKATSKIESFSLGIGGSQEVALAGSASINMIKNGVEAYIKDVTEYNQADPITVSSLSLQAQDGSSIRSLAGGVAIANTVALGAAVAINQIGDNQKGVRAYIDNSAIKTSAEAALEAQFSSKIESVAVGGTASGNFALGGSYVANVINNPTVVTIRNGSKVIAGNNISLKATNTSEIQAAGGGIAGSGQAAFGAAVVKNLIGLEDNLGVQSVISNSVVTSNTGRITLQATSSAQILTLGVGGAGAGNFALGGSVVLNEINLLVTAAITSQSTVTAKEDIFLSAVQKSAISAGAGGVAGAGGSAVGASVATNKISGSGVRAYIDNSTVQSTAKSVELLSTSTGQIKTLGLGGAGAGTFAAGGSVVLNEIALPVSAFIANGSRVTANQIVRLNATEDQQISALAGGVAISGTGAVGAALATNKISGAGVQAYIDGGTVRSEANYVFVVARSTAKIEALTLGGAGDTVASVGASVSLNEINNPVTVRIGGNAQIETAKDIDLRSENTATITAKSGGAAISGGAAGGAAVTTNKINRTTKAVVEDTSSLKAGTYISIKAEDTSTLDALAIGVGLASTVGLGASVSKNEVNNTVDAHISGSTKVESGTSVDVRAKETIQFSGVTGGFGGSLGGGIGGAYTGNTITANTRAYIDGTARLTVGSSLTVDATNNVKSGTVEAYAGGAGLVAGAAAFIEVNSVNNATAYIGSTVDIARVGGTIYVEATSDSNLKSSAKGGAIGAGAVGVVKTNLSETGTTQAYLGNGIKIGSSLNDAPTGLIVRATANNQLEGDTTGASGGFVNGTGSLVDITAAPKVRAWIGDNAKLFVKGDAIVRAFANGIVRGEAWGANASLGVGVGASQATVAWKPTLEASIGQSSILEVASNLEVGSFNNLTASSNSSSPTFNEKAKVTATATTSGGSLVGGLGANATATIEIKQSTQIGRNVQLKANGNLDLLARSYNPIDANATGGGSGVIAKGSAEAIANINNDVRVETGSGVQLTSASGRISLRSASKNETKDTDNNTVIATGGTTGLVTDGGTKATLKETDRSRTVLGQDNRIMTAGDVTIDVDHIANFNVRSKQTINTGGVSQNKSTAEITIDSAIRADIGNNAQIEGNKVLIQAQDSSSKFFVKADAETSAVTADTAATAKILTPSLEAKVQVGNNTILKALTSIKIQAIQSDVRSNSDAYAELSGIPSSFFQDAVPLPPWKLPPFKDLERRTVSLNATAENNQITTALVDFKSGVQVLTKDFSTSANTYSNQYARKAETKGLAGLLGGKNEGGEKRNNRSVTGTPQWTKWLVVDKDGDEFNFNFDPGDLTLREAINLTSSSSPNLITFANSIQQIQLTQAINSLTTYQPVTIDGGTQQVVIKGSSQGRIFDLPSTQTLTLKNLTLMGGGGTAENGGLIRNQGTLNIINSNLMGGQATQNGGAIFNAVTGTLNLINTLVTENQAKNGAAVYSEGDLSIVNSLIYSNITNSGDVIVWKYLRGQERTSPSFSLINNTIIDNANEYLVKIQLGSFTSSPFSLFSKAGVTIANNIFWNSRSLLPGLAIVDDSNSGDHTITFDSNLIRSNDFSSANSPNLAIKNPLVFTGSFPLGYASIRVGNVSRSVPTLDNPNSPVVNKGNNSSLPKDTFDLNGNGNTSEPIPVDLRGRSRIYNGTVDIGAQEYQPVVTPSATATAPSTIALASQPASLVEIPTLGTASAPELLPLQDIVVVAPVAQVPLERGDIFEIVNIATENDTDSFGFNQLPSQGIILLDLDGEVRQITRSLSDANPDLISSADLRRGELIYVHNGSATNDSFEILNRTRSTPARFDINILNTAPILSSAISDQNATENEEFTFALPDDIFYDADWEVGDQLTYSATLADGTSLPQWLKFDSATGIFRGTPTARDLNLLEILVTATDASGASANAKFYLQIDNNFIPDQQVRPNTPFTYKMNANPGYTYLVTQDDGSPLPSWLTFDPQTLTFSGTPTANDRGTIYVKVVVAEEESYTDSFAIEVANWIVDTAIDVDNGNVSPGDVSLREAIRLAQSGDIIAFSPTLNKQVITLTQGELLINKSLTLSGQGEFATVISGNQNNRIFTIDDGNANQQSQIDLFGLTLMNGKVTENGGAIWSKENLTLENVTLSGNEAGKWGGAIWNDQGTLTIENSGLYQNKAIQAGGAIANSGTLKLNNTEISRNTTSGNGGGVYNTGTLVIRSTDITDNIAGTYISIEKGKPSFTLESLGAGGGVFSAGGQVSLVSSTINRNAAAIRGGGITVNQGQLLVQNSAVLNNLAQDGAGISITDGSATVVNSTITLNTSQYLGGIEDDGKRQGGGIYGDRATLAIVSSTIAYNSSISDSPTTDGAGIHLQGGQLQLVNSIVAKNTTTPLGGQPVSTNVVRQNQAQVTLAGSNLVDDTTVTGNGVLNVDPQLAPLQNLGNTWVYPLLAQSPARDRGENGLLPLDLGDSNQNGITNEPIPFDQRGSTRISGGKLDLGAYESQNPQTPVNEEALDWIRGDSLLLLSSKTDLNLTQLEAKEFKIAYLETQDTDLYAVFKLPEQGQLYFVKDDVSQLLTQTIEGNQPLLLREIDLQRGFLEYVHNGTSKDDRLELINLKDGSIRGFALNLSNNAPEVTQSISDEVIEEQVSFVITIPEDIFGDADMFLNDDVLQLDIDPEDREEGDNMGVPRSDSLVYSATLVDGSPLPSWLSFNPDRLEFTGTATLANVGTLEVRLTATDERNAQTSTTFRLIINQTTPALVSADPIPTIVQRKGNFAPLSLQFSLISQSVQPRVINEVGFFAVDNAQGQIENLFPDSPGYLEAALRRATVIFSVLPDNFIPNPNRVLGDITAQFLSFYLVQDGSTDDVINDSTQTSKVILSSAQSGSSVLQVGTLGSNTLQLSFSDPSTNKPGNIILTVSQNTVEAPIGNTIQGQYEREILDLTTFLGQRLTLQLPIVRSEAAFNNTIGFYRIESSRGTVLDPLTSQLFNPGDSGYTLAAIRNSKVYGMSFNRDSQGIQGQLQGGYYYAPFIIADGTVAQRLDRNPNNDRPVYFAYKQANPDQIDHIRLLGDNTWGFEDLPGGGDLDFNDMVIYLVFQGSELSPEPSPIDISAFFLQDVSPQMPRPTRGVSQENSDTSNSTGDGQAQPVVFQPKITYLSSQLNDTLLPEALRKGMFLL